MSYQVPTVASLVGSQVRCRFVRYQSGELWYEVVGKSFTFPVPVTDAGDGAFLPEDRSLFFMRWIRKHVVALARAQAEQAGGQS